MKRFWPSALLTITGESKSYTATESWAIDGRGRCFRAVGNFFQKSTQSLKYDGSELTAAVRCNYPQVHLRTEEPPFCRDENSAYRVVDVQAREGLINMRDHIQREDVSFCCIA